MRPVSIQVGDSFDMSHAYLQIFNFTRLRQLRDIFTPLIQLSAMLDFKKVKNRKHSTQYGNGKFGK